MAIKFQKIIMKNGNKEKLPELDIAEVGICNDTEEFFFGSSSGNVELAKKDFVKQIEETLNGKIETSVKGEKGDKGDPGEAGPQGPQGINGTDGKQIELQKSATHLQWRYAGIGEWADLIALSELKGEQGVKGEKGETGLQGSKGDKGETGEQGAKGEKGDPGIAPEEITAILNRITELEKKVAELGGGSSPEESSSKPNFLGIIDYKNINTITYEDLNVSTVKKGQVAKPETVYTHTGGTMLNKSSIIAFPKEYGSITGVVDGAGISIAATYEWADVTLNIPEIGEVQYVIGGTKEELAYTDSVAVKWQIS
ncbi:collagen triple helix repeat family protein (plasmid) [Clostridium baratii str. Sullivan]|uniref:Collagen triple helix repeat family protein n=1 Tax=Clostridium baratii str. Sullivan TaxID=1415775 RepID=A0A0A7G0E3_9CLOT|nr:collagen-like protein [Clostridium baratii]AIY85334.1 collagen triple helix repeat family protein [Clostridium baratii str. Sullivan]